MGKFLLVVILIAVVIYAVVWLVESRGAVFRRGRGGYGGGPGGKPQRRPSGPVGPDDDPEFLRDLNRRRPRKNDPEG